MNSLEYEMREWWVYVYDLGNIGENLANSAGDVQRERLSLCVTREVLEQCRTIQELFQALSKSMDELNAYMGDETAEIQKVKRYTR